MRIFLAGLPSGNKFWEWYWGEEVNLSSYGKEILSFSSKVLKTNFIRSITAFREVPLHVIPHITAYLCQIKGSVSIVTCNQSVGSGTYRFIGFFCLILSKSNQCRRLFKGNIKTVFFFFLIKAYCYLSRKKHQITFVLDHRYHWL